MDGRHRYIATVANDAFELGNPNTVEAVMSEHVTGVILPQIKSADDIRHLAEIITNLEQGKRLNSPRLKETATRALCGKPTPTGCARAMPLVSVSGKVP